MKNQKGFSAVEGLLILVIVAIIGGTGYFVMSTQKKTNTNLDNAAQSSQVVPKPKSSTAAAQKYLEIKEWGVKVPLSSKDSGAYYKVDTDISQSQNDPTNLTAYATQIDDLTSPAGVSCRGEYLGYLLRLPKDDPTWAPSANVDDGNVSPLFYERIVVGKYKYALATKKQYGPDCLAVSKTGDYTLDEATSQKFSDVVQAFAADFKNITAN